MTLIKGFGARSREIPEAFLYIVAGPEEFFRMRAIEAVVQRSAPPEDRAMSVRTFDAKEATLGELMTELDSPSLFALNTVVIVRNAAATIRDNKKLLAKFARSQDATRRLVLETHEPAKKLGLAKGLAEAAILECYGLWSRDVPRFLSAEAKRWEKRIKSDAAAVLEYRVGTDASALADEIEKLAIFVGERREITVDDVDELAGGYRAFDVFELAGCMVERDVKGAFRAAGRLREEGASPAAVAAVLWKVLQRILKMKRLLSNGASLREASSKAGFRWWEERRMGTIAQSADLEALEDAFCVLARADAASKQGIGSDETAIEELVVRLAGALSAGT